MTYGVWISALLTWNKFPCLALAYEAAATGAQKP